MKIPSLPSFPSFFWKIALIIVALISWELVARSGIFSSFIFPSITDTLNYMVSHPQRLLQASSYTLKLLLLGLTLSCLVGFLMGGLTAISKKMKSVMETIVSIISPIPASSMLPFAILWFGLGEDPIIFVTFFGSISPFLINVINAFSTINKTQMDVGRNFGLEGFRLVRHVLLPASSPHIISGFRAAWGVAWRSVVAAELIFGAVGGKGGLGWLIYMNRFQLNSAGMLGALFCISIIGIIAENILLELLERETVKKWGMKR